jgi:homoserine dehydrogenase
MAGTPSYNLLDMLPGIDVKKLRGILNGTSNFILTEMQKGETFEKALAIAQSNGYAEANPTMDVDGYDAALKTIIISNVLGWFSSSHTLGEMQVEGIRNLKQSNDPKKKIKLLARADEGGASVKPELVGAEDIFANVDGVLNALELETDTLGKIVSIGPGAGKYETAQAVLSDLSSITE